MVRARRILAPIMAVAIAMPACSTEPKEAPPPPAPTAPEFPLLNYSFVWHDTPGSDLYSPDGTFIRAATESFYRGINANGPNGGFPGYTTAVAGAPDANHTFDIASQHIRDPSERSGALHARILHIDDADPIVVDLCIYFDQLHVTSLDDPSRYYASMPSDLTIDSGQLRYSRHGTPPPAAQSGEANRPETSPFGQWTIDEYSFIGSDRPYEEVAQQRTACEAARGDIPHTDNAPGTIPKTDVPITRPFPGWPSANSA